MSAVERFYFTAAAMIFASGPLSGLVGLYWAWQSLLSGEYWFALGQFFVAVVAGGAFGILLSGTIETVYRAGMAAQAHAENADHRTVAAHD